MSESDAAWTPAYESIAQAMREEEEKSLRWERTLFWIDLFFAALTTGYLIYVCL